MVSLCVEVSQSKVMGTEKDKTKGVSPFEGCSNEDTPFAAYIPTMFLKYFAQSELV